MSFLKSIYKAAGKGLKFVTAPVRLTGNLVGHSPIVGKPVKGMDIWRVLTRDFCRKHHALDDVVWEGTPLNKIYSLDPAYGGGDLCVGRELRFGKDIKGKQILWIGEPEIIPISPKSPLEPEEQIAAFIKNRLEQLEIDAKNCFYDSFGRGTLGFQFAKWAGRELDGRERIRL